MVLSKRILIYRLSRLFPALVVFGLFLIFYQRTNQIEHVVFDSETQIDSTRYEVGSNNIIIKSPVLSNAYSYTRPYDLSKTIYTINFSDKPFLGWREVWIQYIDDVVEFSPFDNSEVLNVPFGDDVIFIDGYKKKDVHFFTKNVSGENMQFVRNFFLTEILCFLFVFILSELYSIWRTRQHLCGKRHYIKRHRPYVELSLYGTLVIACVIVILRLNTIKIVNVDTEHYTMDLSGELFSMYDISCRAFHYDLSKENIHNGEVVWSSTEIVDFPPMTPEPKATFNRAVFQTDKDGGFRHDFITENLASKNYQDMRIFIVSTLLALFFARFINSCWNYNSQRKYQTNPNTARSRNR